MQFYRFRHWRPVEQLANRPDLAQLEVLRKILSANRDTTFGTQHGFGTITTYRDYYEHVPVQEYEQLRPYIDQQRLTKVPALTIEPPLFYAQTSGSTGTPKYIPVTAGTLANQRSEQALFSYLQFRTRPQAFRGMALGIMGAAVVGRLESGHPVGSVSGYLYRSLPRTVRSRFVVPPAVFEIADYSLKYQVILQLALAQPDITYIGSPNPSTFLRMLDILNDRRDVLLNTLGTGAMGGLAGLNPAKQRLVSAGMIANPARAAALRRLPTLSFADVWPQISLVTTWTGGSCGIALAKLRDMLPRDAAVMELGYQATECRGTMALDVEDPGGIPPLHHTFFEFVEQQRWDEGRPEFLMLGQLEAGARYYVLITTSSGLYRYFMNDLLEVTGHYRHTPLLRFLQKGRGVTSLTGEKLYEVQAIEAVQDAAARHGLATAFFILVADAVDSTYRLFIELDDTSASATDLAQTLDERLGELNIEYRAKRASGRLTPPRVVRLRRGAADAYKAACVQAGQREGQYKPAVLQYASDLAMGFGDYEVRA